MSLQFSPALPQDKLNDLNSNFVRLDALVMLNVSAKVEVQVDLRIDTSLFSVRRKCAVVQVRR